MSAFLLMLAGHALCDYPLQGDFLARGKNHKAPLPGVPFYHCLLSHAAIHGGMVGLVTGSVGLGLAEFVVHALIDFGKCDGLYGFDLDQALHVACKAAWAACTAWGFT
jgi:hypothetical protein